MTELVSMHTSPDVILAKLLGESVVWLTVLIGVLILLCTRECFCFCLLFTSSSSSVLCAPLRSLSKGCRSSVLRLAFLGDFLGALNDG